jgi:hypothetical protein
MRSTFPEAAGCSRFNESTRKATDDHLFTAFAARAIEMWRQAVA